MKEERRADRERHGGEWTRRRFLAVSTAATAHAAGLAQAAAAQEAAGQLGTAAQQTAAHRTAAAAQREPEGMPPPGVITGGIRPLLAGTTARPLRYRPEGIDFVIRNGSEYFNRPLYGPNIDFRVDAGDLPEFSLYLPGHGGNLRLGFVAANGRGRWAAQADEVTARYRPGRMIYEVRDALLGTGWLQAELMTAGAGSGLLCSIAGHGLAAGVQVAWAFAGLSGRKGRRNGDIGCEVQPVSQFFQVRPEECEGNAYTLGADGRTATLTARAATLRFAFPVGTKLRVEDFAAWDTAPQARAEIGAGAATPAAAAAAARQPVLTGWAEVGDEPLLLSLHRVEAGDGEHDGGGQETGGPAGMAAWSAREAQVDALARKLTAETPDEYVNAAAAALGVAADALWDARQGCIMHGAVAWRVALAGWRGPYCLDALGDHARAVTNFRHWTAKQNVQPVTTGDPARGPWDEKSRHTRKESLLHSNGDLSNNHYDMNLVLVDAMLRHLNWTGDLELARELWPALERHLAWEHRLFRRSYAAADGAELPLYEAYAAIWASDNLQYNGGGAAHSSAYNVYALRTAARLAQALGRDGSAYAAEAELVQRGLDELLWLPEAGVLGEAKDLMQPQTVYSNPALWTVYHAIDSEAVDARRAWQMCAERLAALRAVPIHGAGVPDEGLYMLACSDWMPYLWSLNLLLLAENAHMALALWQAGMREEAWRIYKGSLLGSQYMGLCPGDFHMTSALDVHRQEAQRDFGDPIGISSRALVEGLFGVRPELLAGRVTLAPGWPLEWANASLRHADFTLDWRREGQRETLRFVPRFGRPVALRLLLPARASGRPRVRVNGAEAACAFDATAVGAPRLRVDLPPAAESAAGWEVTVEWHGAAPSARPATATLRLGERLRLPQGATLAQVDDPQGCLREGRAAREGFHTVFLRMREGECAWTMPLSFTVQPEAAVPAVPPLSGLRAETLSVLREQTPGGVHEETVDLSGVLCDRVTEIFTRGYVEPRSPFCSLAIPDTLLGGWANFDGRASISDAGLRAAGGRLRTPLGVTFATPAGEGPNCRFVSHWQQDEAEVRAPLTGRARGLYLLLAGSTNPQCTRMTHATVTVRYAGGTSAALALRSPETWWPIEQDYLLDDYMFVDDAPLPPRVSLATGETRMLDAASFRGRGRNVPGGAATIHHLALDPAKELQAMELRVELYGVVVALLAATLARA